jgi:hypothetical protein
MSNLIKFLITILILISFNLHGQIGGKLRETKNQRKLAKHIRRSGWVERKWVPNKLKIIEPDRKLFKRYRTTNSKIKDKLQRDINYRRTKRRIRGNDVFHKRKYFR